MQHVLHLACKNVPVIQKFFFWNRKRNHLTKMHLKMHLKSSRRDACEVCLILYTYFVFLTSVLWRCWLGSIQPAKTEWWGTGMVICLERGANNLHISMCKLFAHADATATLLSLASLKSRMKISLLVSKGTNCLNLFHPIRASLSRLSLKRPLNRCSVV